MLSTAATRGATNFLRHAWKGSRQLDFGLGATLACFGEGKVYQTAQGVRFKGKFDTNMALFLGGTLRYVF